MGCNGDGDLLFPFSSGGIKLWKDVLFGGSGGTAGAGDGVLRISFSFTEDKHKLNCELLGDGEANDVACACLIFDPSAIVLKSAASGVEADTLQLSVCPSEDVGQVVFLHDSTDSTVFMSVGSDFDSAVTEGAAIFVLSDREASLVLLSGSLSFKLGTTGGLTGIG